MKCVCKNRKEKISAKFLYLVGKFRSSKTLAQTPFILFIYLFFKENFLKTEQNKADKSKTMTPFIINFKNAVIG